MTWLQNNDLMYNTGIDLGDADREWEIARFTFGANPMVNVGDILNMFPYGICRGYYIANYWIGMEQMELNTAAPQLRWNFGYALNDNTMYSSPGLRPIDNKLMGHTPGGLIHYADNMEHFKQNGSNMILGLQVASLPSQADFANKTIAVGLLLKPALIW